MRRWRWPIVSLAAGSVIFGLSWASGYGWEMIWLPAVMLGAAWPRDPRDTSLARCLSGLRRRPGRSRRT